MSRKELYVCLPAYGAITLVMTFPVWLHLLTRAPFGGDHLYHMLWNFWWVKKAVLSSELQVYVTPFLFHPCSTSLAFHNLSLGQTITGLLARGPAGVAFLYNFLWIMSFYLSALGAYVLAREEGAHPSGAFLGGVIFSFSSAHFLQASHLNIVAIQWLPFFALCALRTLRRKGRFWPVATALTAVMAAVVSWYFAVYVILLGAVLLLSHLITAGRDRGRAAARFSAATLLAAILLLPLAAPLVTEVLAVRSESASTDSGHFSADLVAFFLPQPNHPLWRAGLEGIYAGLSGGSEKVVTLGYTVSILLLVGLFRLKPKEGFSWKLAFLFFSVMALGPQLKIMNEVHSPALLPYQFLIQGIPGLNVSRVASRFAIPASLAASVVCALLWSRLVDRGLLTRRRLALTCAVALLVLFEHLHAPIHVTRIEEPPGAYAHIGKDREDFAILELPHCIDWDCGAGRYMYYQTFHSKPIHAGYIPRKPECPQRLLQSYPVLAWAADMDNNAAPSCGALVEYLESHGVKYVVLHSSRATVKHHLDLCLDRLETSDTRAHLYRAREMAGKSPRCP